MYFCVNIEVAKYLWVFGSMLTGLGIGYILSVVVFREEHSHKKNLKKVRTAIKSKKRQKPEEKEKKDKNYIEWEEI